MPVQPLLVPPTRDRLCRLHLSTLIFNATWGKEDPVDALMECLTNVSEYAIREHDYEMQTVVNLVWQWTCDPNVPLDKPWEHIYHFLGV